MTEENPWGNPIEWIGVLVAMAGAGLAWHRAGQSNSTAASSNLTAKSALPESKRANRTAEAANGIAAGAASSAADAVTEARRSADIAERVEGRQTERNNVMWNEPRKQKSGEWKVANNGIDTAFEAYVVLEVDGHRIASEPSDVPGGHSIVIDISEIHKAKVARNQAATAQMRSAGITYFASSAVKVKAQVLWRTQQGSWHTFESGKKTA